MRSNRIAATLALLAPLAALAQFPTEPPKSFPRVVEYKCSDGANLSVSYSDKGDFARIIAGDSMWKALPVAGSAGKFADANAKIEWQRKGADGVLSELGSGKVLKTCKAAASKK